MNEAPAPENPTPDEKAQAHAQAIVVTLAVALMGASIGLRVITGAGLTQTAVLFVALPAILAVAVAGTRPARSTTGLIFRTSAIVLLLASTLFGETLICVIIASPLVFIVGAAVGIPIDRRRRARAAGASGTKYTAVVGLVLLAGLEGAVPLFDAPREATVTVTRFVEAPASEIVATLAQRPDFSRPPPLPLQVGFPRVVGATGSGLAVGDRRWIRIEGDGHYNTIATGQLTMEVTQRTPDSVRFTAVDDTSRVSDWLRWRHSDVSWAPRDGGTVVTWTVHYERQLAPAWYFDPLQRGAVRLTANYLIDTLVTPRD